MKLVRDGNLNSARWAEFATDVWGDWELLAEALEIDYSGWATFTAKEVGKPRWVYVSWNYGSCSGCDSWEDLPAEEVSEAMLASAAKFVSLETFRAFLKRIVDGGSVDGGGPASEYRGSREVAAQTLALLGGKGCLQTPPETDNHERGHSS